MDNLTGLNSGLGGLPLITNARTRSISAENPTGEKGTGGMAVPDPRRPRVVRVFASQSLRPGVESPALCLVEVGGVDYVDGC